MMLIDSLYINDVKIYCVCGLLIAQGHYHSIGKPGFGRKRSNVLKLHKEKLLII